MADKKILSGDIKTKDDICRYLISDCVPTYNKKKVIFNESENRKPVNNYDEEHRLAAKKEEEEIELLEEQQRRIDEERAYQEGLAQIKEDYPTYNTDYAAFRHDNLDDVRRDARHDDYLMNW